MAAEYQEQQESFVDFLHDRSSSPFDFKSSFVRFPPMVTKANDTKNASSTKHNQNKVKIAIVQLAESMGYQTKSIGLREAQLIHADALTCIEKLTLGLQSTRRPRDLDPAEVLVKLRSIVPEQYFRPDTKVKQFQGDRISHDDECVLRHAAANYIQVLKKHKHKHHQFRGKHVASADNGLSIKLSNQKMAPLGDDDVGKTLERIDTWCSRWLDGEIADADWEKMQELA